MYARNRGKIGLLVIINLLLLAGFPMVLHYLEIINVWNYLEWVPFVGDKSEDIQILEKTEPVDLLMKEQLLKEQERLTAWEQQILNREEELKQMEDSLNEKILEYQKIKEESNQRENEFQQKEKQYQNRQNNINQVAEYLVSMDPKYAVSILQDLDSQDVIDVLRRITLSSREAGQGDITPYLLQLMASKEKEKEVAEESGIDLEYLKKSRELVRLMLKYPSEDVTKRQEQAIQRSNLLREMGLEEDKFFLQPRNADAIPEVGLTPQMTAPNTTNNAPPLTEEPSQEPTSSEATE